jgi:hypothetical protein
MFENDRVAGRMRISLEPSRAVPFERMPVTGPALALRHRESEPGRDDERLAAVRNDL